MYQEVKVKELPKCDFCSKKAEYDGKTWIGCWAYMCPDHFKQYGKGLGLGKGQKLVIDTKPKNTCIKCGCDLSIEAFVYACAEGLYCYRCGLIPEIAERIKDTCELVSTYDIGIGK